MTIEDTLLAMESLWGDLCRQRPVMEPPAWHRDLLDERERNLQAGSDELLDWGEKCPELFKKKVYNLTGLDNAPRPKEGGPQAR